MDLPDLVPPRRALSRALRSPALHFLLIGALLYAAAGAFTGPETEQRGVWIDVSPEELGRLEREWAQRSGRLPDAETKRALLRSHVDDELLLREAIALGWDRSDPVVRQRLVRNQRFLDPDSVASDASLLRSAYAQGMDASDVVVRRRLLERMRLALAEAAREPEPSTAELAEYLARSPGRFTRPPRLRVSHVFLSRDRRGDRLGREARELLQKLRAGPVTPEAADRFGDPFLLGNHLPAWSEAVLARQLGPGFAGGARSVPVGAWSEPVESAYGLHLLWVHERHASEEPALAEIRSEVRAALLREREEAGLREHLAELRRGVRVRLLGESPQVLSAASLASGDPDPVR